jgi:hypothetical protein
MKVSWHRWMLTEVMAGQVKYPHHHDDLDIPHACEAEQYLGGRNP